MDSTLAEMPLVAPSWPAEEEDPLVVEPASTHANTPLHKWLT